jgi:hypothetical protein
MFAAMAVLAATMAGCAGPGNRESALDDLNPAPLPAATWARVRGAYTGSIRATTERFGLEDTSATDVRLNLSGPVDSPGVLLRTWRGYSTGWTEYGEWKGTFTNIPQQRYGTQGTVFASTHYPNQALLVLRRNGASQYGGVWMILTFRDTATIDVDWIGHAGWRGEGVLTRVPSPASLR